MDQKIARLKRFNIIMGLIHFAQGTVLLLLASDFSLPITTAFLRFDQASGKLIPQVEEAYLLQIAPLIAAFLFISALAHFCISSPGIYEWYKRNLGKGINYARWIEYSFSSSIMIVIISMLVGIYDIVSLLAIFSLNAGMILFGWVMEVHNQTTKKTNWTSYIFGSILGIIPWIGIAIYLFGSGGEGAEPPTFVYYIFLSIFIFFDVFALNMLLQYKKIGPWRDYLFGEKVYIILSLVAKSALAWQVFAGTLRP